MADIKMTPIRAKQARCKALGFDPGPIDGIDGDQTRAAYAAAVAAQKAKGLPFQHDTGITRIHWHWTGGTYQPDAHVLNSYHIVINGDGQLIRANNFNRHLSHTLNANSGAIAIAICAMGEAVDSPFRLGKYPIRQSQITALVAKTATICGGFDIPVSRWSTLSHGEVQPTLGVTQRGKWDIGWLPGMDVPASPVAVGDGLREMVTEQLKRLANG